jgi:phosphohistidine phosphatase
MDLILWRHAEAEDAGPGEDDLARALTAKGRQQAARAGAWLARHLDPATRVLASPALRCRQTADALGRPFQTVAGIAPDRGVEALLRAAGWPDADGAVLVVGHQPTLGRTAAVLLSGVEREWTVKKGAVWWFRRRAASDADDVVLRAVLAPDLA